MAPAANREIGESQRGCERLSDLQLLRNKMNKIKAQVESVKLWITSLSDRTYINIVYTIIASVIALPFIILAMR